MDFVHDHRCLHATATNQTTQVDEAVAGFCGAADSGWWELA